jgi:hypothetical protein
MGAKAPAENVEDRRRDGQFVRRVKVTRINTDAQCVSTTNDSNLGLYHRTVAASAAGLGSVVGVVTTHPTRWRKLFTRSRQSDVPVKIGPLFKQAK